MSPHLQVWKWGPHMLVSILHRVTGSGMATVGTLLMVWWLAAAASGKEAYATFEAVMHFYGLGYLFGVGLTLCLFIHIGNGIRHFFMDAGALFELKANKTASLLVIVFGILATAAFWAWIILGK
jgi:succinate dehydrogenase / fumarate reductase, cytochrome b subunit